MRDVYPPRFFWKATVFYEPRKFSLCPNAKAKALKRIYVSVYSERFKKIISIK